MYSYSRLEMPAFLDTAASLGAFVLASLRPDFWRPASKAQATAQPNKPNKVAYLDGLRGAASFIVYLSHHAGYAHTDTFAFQHSYGWHGNYYFSCLPYVRLFFNGGSFSVALFFIISGYVLSRSPLRMIYEKDSLKLANHLGVAIPRRLIRLYFPVFTMTLAFATSWHVLGIRANNTVVPPPEPTYLQEVWHWLVSQFGQTYIFHNNTEGLNPYNPQLWNIPAQFRASLLTYLNMLVMLAFANYPHRWRLGGEVGLIIYCLFVIDGWYCGLVTVGVLLCDLDLLAERDQLPKFFNKLKPLAARGWIYYVLLIASLYLSGAPRVSDPESLKENDPGWYILATLVPGAVSNAKWFFQFWAATFAMIAIPRIPWTKAFLELPVCRYMGKLSFAMYLCHGPVLWTLGDRIYAAVGRPRNSSLDMIPGWVDLLPLPGVGPLGLEVNYLAAHLVLLPFTLWIAGIVNKLFDEPSAQLARWMFDPSRFDVALIN